MLNSIFYILTVITVKAAQIDLGPAIYDKVFDKYNKNIRPKRNVFDFITIEINPLLHSVESVNGRQELITLYYWFNIKWIDEYLQWNETEMGGVDMIHVPSTVLWLPDIAVDSIIKLSDIPDIDDVYCRMFSTGNIKCSFNQVVEVHCPMEVSNFPFDKQNCTIIYYSWFHNADQIRLTTPSLNGNIKYFKVPMHVVYMVTTLKLVLPNSLQEFFQNNTEWNLLEYTNLNFFTEYEAGSYSEVHYYIILQRKPLYYIVSLVMPIFLLTTVCIVGLFSPNQACGEREEEVNMGLTALLTMAVLLLVINEEMPKTSNGLPILGIYLLFEMYNASIATLVTVWIMSLNKRAVKRERIPNWLLCVTRIKREKKDRACSSKPFNSKQESEEMIENTMFNLSMRSVTPHHFLTQQALTHLVSFRKSVDDKLERCLSHLLVIQKRMEEYETDEECMKAWNKVCDRLDDIFMFIFMSLNLMATFVFFFVGLSA